MNDAALDAELDVGGTLMCQFHASGMEWSLFVFAFSSICTVQCIGSGQCAHMLDAILCEYRCKHLNPTGGVGGSASLG